MRYWLAFDEEWFAKRQTLLLWLLNAPILLHWFRWCLRIRRHDCMPSEYICEIGPNRFMVWLDENRLRADIRTHWKFSKRIYYAFRPLWWMMHAWDTLADPFCPQLSFGFATLTAYPNAGAAGPDTVDGRVIRSASEAWATLIAGAGTAAYPLETGNQCVQMDGTATTDVFSNCNRALFLFSTKSLKASAITAATLSLWGYFKQDTLSTGPDVNIYSSNPASNTNLVAGDYNTFGSTPFSTTVTYSLFNETNTVYTDFILNADGLAAIPIGGVAKLGTRDATHDAGGVKPNWISGGSSLLAVRYADLTGNVNDPKLVITYVPMSPILKPNRIRPRMFVPGIAR